MAVRSSPHPLVQWVNFQLTHNLFVPFLSIVSLLQQRRLVAQHHQPCQRIAVVSESPHPQSAVGKTGFPLQVPRVLQVPQLNLARTKPTKPLERSESKPYSLPCLEPWTADESGNPRRIKTRVSRIILHLIGTCYFCHPALLPLTPFLETCCPLSS